MIGSNSDWASYKNDQEAWEAARQTAKKQSKGNRAAIKAALDAIGSAPAQPPDPLLTCPEPTFEGLCRLFMVGQASLGLFSTEGGQFIGGHGMNAENKLKTASGLSDIWDGSSIRRVRSVDGAVLLAGRRLSLHLMVQPAVADLLFGDQLLADQGLLSRLLVTAPESAAGTRFQRRERAETDGELKRYAVCLADLLVEPLPLVPGKLNELDPRPLALSPEARQLWSEFADHFEREMAHDGELEPVRGLANKLPEHAARLAAVLTLVGDVNAAYINATEMQAGIVLAGHYAAEALRLFGASGVHPDLRLAQRLLDWLLRRAEPVISLPDIYQRSLNAIRDKATAMKLVKLLVDHGWLVPITEGATVAGQHRREVWRIVRGV